MRDLLEARRRYDAIRRQLDLSSETDRGLHLCLTEAIRSLDRKIDRLTGLRDARDRGQRKAARASG